MLFPAATRNKDGATRKTITTTTATSNPTNVFNYSVTLSTPLATVPAEATATASKPTLSVNTNMSPTICKKQYKTSTTKYRASHEATMAKEEEAAWKTSIQPQVSPQERLVTVITNHNAGGHSFHSRLPSTSTSPHLSSTWWRREMSLSENVAFCLYVRNAFHCRFYSFSFFAKTTSETFFFFLQCKTHRYVSSGPRDLALIRFKRRYNSVVLYDGPTGFNGKLLYAGPRECPRQGPRQGRKLEITRYSLSLMEWPPRRCLFSHTRKTHATYCSYQRGAK